MCFLDRLENSRYINRKLVNFGAVLADAEGIKCGKDLVLVNRRALSKKSFDVIMNVNSLSVSKLLKTLIPEELVGSVFGNGLESCSQGTYTQ